MSVHKWVPAVVAWLVAIGGCANQQQTRATTPAPAVTAASAIAPPSANTYVPAGTEFTVILNDVVGSASSIRGQPFTGQLNEPLRAADGSVFAPAGATVHGNVGRVASAAQPSLRLDFLTVETPTGAAVLETSVRDANGYALVVRSNPADTPEGEPDTILYPPAGPIPSAVGGGPRSPEAQAATASPSVLLPCGTRIRLVLNHPLLAPDFSAQYGE